MNLNSRKGHFLFETSWEVCNKVGGIYTVLSTKAKILQSEFKGHVVFIGPDMEAYCGAQQTDFIPDASLLDGFEGSSSVPEGLPVKVGVWDIPTSPIAVLVDFRSMMPKLPGYFGKMWENFGVDSLHAYGDYDEGCAFAIAVSEVMKGIARHLEIKPCNVIAHFNEWTTGMGLLNMELIMPEAATVFTTHATSIGRSICSNGKQLYEYFAGYHGDQMARELNMEAKHSLEKQAAHSADCFTTVSEVTARECQQLLDIRPQVVTPNGFERAFVPVAGNYTKKRKEARAVLLDTASAVSGRLLPDDTFIVATSGRNEFRNKGIDMYIDAMESVRRQLTSGSRQVLALVLVPAWTKEPSADRSLDFTTHRLNNEESDSIFLKLKSLGNKGEDNLTFMFVPCYLNGKDGVINVSYYDVLPGLDMTVFPSYYEPWGYTPLESVAFGVPTVTTDKAGFGKWVEDNFTNSLESCGVKVVRREDSNYPDAVRAIAHEVERMSQAPEAEIKKVKKSARATAKCADWTAFIKKYEEAFEVAERRAAERNKKP